MITMAEPCYENHDIMTQLALSGADEEFRLTFDMFTPRPHFMVLPRDREEYERRSPGPFFDLEEDRQIRIISLALKAQQHLSLRKTIFSLHRGLWLRCPRMLTTHIVTDKQQYLDLFDSLKRRRPMSAWWPSSSGNLITNQWVSGASDPELKYLQTLKGYPHRSYQSDDIADIFVYKSVCVLKGETSRPLSAEVTERVTFHTSKKQIGIEDEGSDQPHLGPEEVLELVKKLDLVAITCGAPGYHICVDLKAKGFTGFRVRRDSSRVLGYIEVPGDTFYKNCPVAYRDEWFEQYKASDDKVYT